MLDIIYITYIYKLSSKMLKLPKFYLKPYNLQNTAINVIIIKRLLD